MSVPEDLRNISNLFERISHEVNGKNFAAYRCRYLDGSEGIILDKSLRFKREGERLLKSFKRRQKSKKQLFI